MQCASGWGWWVFHPLFGAIMTPRSQPPHSQNTNPIRREGGDQPRCRRLSLIWWEEEGDFKPASD